MKQDHKNRSQQKTTAWMEVEHRKNTMKEDDR